MEDAITHKQSDKGGEKIFYLQKLRLEDGRFEIRLCYYIIGKKPRMKGESVFGKFETIMPPDDFKAIVDKAKKRGWI